MVGLMKLTSACILLLVVVFGESTVAFGSRHTRALKDEGNRLLPTEISYVVSIRNTEDKTHVCGGVLIAPNIVLTSASCTQPRKMLSVRTGALLLTESVGSFVDEFAVEQIVAHPKWDGIPANGFDIALLKLEKSTKNDPVALATSSDQLKKDVSVFGWGRFDEGSPFSNELQVADLTVVSKSKCKKIREEKILDSMICAGGNVDKKAACDGDQGGPLVIKGEKRDILIGIVSIVSPNCKEDGPPNVFTNIVSYREWIFPTIRAVGGALLRP